MARSPKKSVPSKTGETSTPGNGCLCESEQVSYQCPVHSIIQNSVIAQNCAEPAEKKVIGRPFEKGPDPRRNEGGRPKKLPITEMYAEILADPDVAPRLREAVVAMLFSGKMAAQLQLKEMAERVEGKVVQPVEADVNLNLGISDRLLRAKERLEQLDKERNENS